MLISRHNPTGIMQIINDVRIYLRRVPSLFLPSGQSSSTAESEAITSSHSLPGRGVAFSNRLNITIARFLNYFSEQNLKLTIIFFVVMHLFYKIL